MKTRRLAVLLVLLTFITATVSAVISIQKMIPSSGNIVVVIPTPPPIDIVDVLFYSDPAATIEVTTVDWGVMNPGSIRPIILYLKNTGNIAETVTLSAGNYKPPELQGIMTLSWDSEGIRIEPGQVMKTNITLEVSGSVTGISTFSLSLIFSLSG